MFPVFLNFTIVPEPDELFEVTKLFDNQVTLKSNPPEAGLNTLIGTLHVLLTLDVSIIKLSK